MPGGLRGGLRIPRSETARGRRSDAARAVEPAKAPKKKISAQAAWREARALVLARKGRLALGLALMLVNRLVGLVLPATSKFLIDDVIGKGRADLLMPLALAAGAATIVQAVTSFALSQVLGVAAQRAITDMRRRIEAHVARLPVRYFDSTQAGVLISRIMSDAEGIRNIVGTGLVQLTGSIVTALIALGDPVLSELVAHAGDAGRARRVRRRDGAGVQPPAAALPRAREDQRRGDGPAERDARRHPHRQDLHRREARRAGVHEGRASPVSQHRQVDHRRVGDHRVLDRGRRRDRRDHDRDRRPVDPLRRHDARRLHLLPRSHRADGRAGRPDCLHRHADQRSVRRPRSDSRAPRDGYRGRRGQREGAARADRRRSHLRARAASNTTPASRC